ncbi:unnamed protein product [Ceutorhynchus assimilis]|uniref:Uncharacterized protein n=1 Tax=Ceutorhynchus assimilis TaxID=467358 RepID=A0A9N9MEU0_9CUCU|nr:unnamed protein product [Ceutorhynchus assimilis]
MRSQIMKSTRKTITKLKTTRNPKISPERQQLITERRKLEKGTPQYREMNKTVNKAIRKDTRIHSTNMIKECIAQNSNMKVLRKNRAKGRNKIYQLTDSEGNLVSTTESMLKIVEQSYTILYRKPTINQPSRPPVTNVGSEEVPEVDVDEIKKALS